MQDAFYIKIQFDI